MSEWQPIETAPSDKVVKLGRWYHYDKDKWSEDFGVAFQSTWFGLSRSPTWNGSNYTHWKPVPPPPGEGA